MGLTLFGAIAAGPVMQMGGHPAAAAFSATLIVDTGPVEVRRVGTAALVAARGGEALRAGDVILTGPTGLARILYSGGSVATLEAATKVTVTQLRSDPNGAFHVRLRQDAGRTWNRVVKLIGGSGYGVDGPNNSVAEVRGTEFAVSVTSDPDNTAVVTIDLASGLLDVTGGGLTVRLEAGAATTVRGQGAPAPPVVSHLQPPPPAPAPLPATRIGTSATASAAPGTGRATAPTEASTTAAGRPVRAGSSSSDDREPAAASESGAGYKKAPPTPTPTSARRTHPGPSSADPDPSPAASSLRTLSMAHSSAGSAAPIAILPSRSGDQGQDLDKQSSPAAVASKTRGKERDGRPSAEDAERHQRSEREGGISHDDSTRS